MDPSLLRVGEFLRRTRLSPKALRLYEAAGLITPAGVDPFSGYRGYTADQVERARLIGLLRRIGMPLVRVAGVIDLEPGARRAAVEGWWASVEADVRQRRALLDTLYRSHEEEPAVHDIALRTVPGQDLLTTERRQTVDGLSDFIGTAVARITAHLETSGAAVAGPLRVIYHGMVTEDSDGPVEVAIPFTGSVAPVDDLRVRRDPGGTEAWTALTRQEAEFPQVLGAYDDLGRWIDDSDLHRAGHPAEVYLNPRDVAPHVVHMEVVWPVSRD
jgi:DNA-binding transcriptional MerR regulator